MVRSEGEAATGDSVVDAAYDYAGQVYNFYLNNFGRDSFDDDGSTLKVSVHWCWDKNCNINNAIWNGNRTKFTEGFVVDDVVGHEFTHGVIQHTAKLFYYMQSGALNESYADIFGEAIDLTYHQPGEPTGDAWWVGCLVLYPVSSEFRINESTSGDQTAPVVAASNGSFMVA